MPDRRWSDADRELVEEALLAAPGSSRDQSWGWVAELVLDALTAAGWRRETDTAEAISQRLMRLAERASREDDWVAAGTMLAAADFARAHAAEAVRADLAEVEPYGFQRTHDEYCWKYHGFCLAARIRATLAEATASRDRWHGHALDLRAELRQARREMPKNIVGYVVTQPDGTQHRYDPADLSVVIREADGHR